MQAMNKAEPFIGFAFYWPGCGGIAARHRQLLIFERIHPLSFCKRVL